jgi:hypothetical protein
MLRNRAPFIGLTKGAEPGVRLSHICDCQCAGASTFLWSR